MNRSVIGFALLISVVAVVALTDIMPIDGDSQPQRPQAQQEQNLRFRHDIQGQ